MFLKIAKSLRRLKRSNPFVTLLLIVGSIDKPSSAVHLFELGLQQFEVRSQLCPAMNGLHKCHKWKRLHAAE